jgi:hypothetical protein
MITRSNFNIIASGLEDLRFFEEATCIDKIAARVCGKFIKTAAGFGDLLELQQYLPYNINKELSRRIGINKMRRNVPLIAEYVKSKMAEGIDPFKIEEAEQVNGFVDGIIGAIDEAEKKGGVAAPTVVPPEEGLVPSVEKPVVDRSEKAKSVDEWYGATHLSDVSLDKIKAAIANDRDIIINYETKGTGEIKVYRVRPKEIGIHHKSPTVVLWAEHDGIVHSYILDRIQRVDATVVETAA